VLGLHSAVFDYDYDAKGQWFSLTLQFDCDAERLLLVSLIEAIAPKLVVRATAGIKRCALSKSNEELKNADMVAVEGVNLVELWKYADVIDVDRLSSNDIWAVCVCVCVCVCVWYHFCDSRFCQQRPLRFI
jgi:DNA-directed RNA polymerase I subunit RPA1